METTKTIEINGVKLEVDLRTAKRIDTLKVGQKVKVLKKEYTTYKVMHGVIVGFEPFDKLPTIVIAAAKVEYSEAKIEFIYYNSKLEDVEVVVADDNDKVELDKNDFIEKVNREITKKENEITELKARKDFFVRKFDCYWSNINLNK